MAARSTSRGHVIVSDEGGDNWVYEDTGEHVCNDLDRPCKCCGAEIGADEPDSCLGYLPGVKYACCGHGNKEQAYIIFENGVTVRGFDVTVRNNVRKEYEKETKKIQKAIKTIERMIKNIDEFDEKSKEAKEDMEKSLSNIVECARTQIIDWGDE